VRESKVARTLLILALIDLSGHVNALQFSGAKILGDQKVSVHLMITVQKTRKNTVF